MDAWRKIWNRYYPNDQVSKGDGFDIHHKDGNRKNNRKEE